jgi:hypothetical protein
MVNIVSSRWGTIPSTAGAMTRAARKPRTTLGRPAISSIVGLIRAFARGRRNSLV